MIRRSWGNKDFWAGVVFVFFGSLALVVVRKYPMGKAARMGPGFFPGMVSCLLILFGILIAARGLRIGNEKIGAFSLRPFLLIFGATLAFGLLLQPLGLIAATLVLLFMSALGGWEFRVREGIIFFFLLILLTVGIFVFGLQLPFKVWPG